MYKTLLYVITSADNNTRVCCACRIFYAFFVSFYSYTYAKNINGTKKKINNNKYLSDVYLQ